MTIEKDFLFDTNYNPTSNFTRIKYGIDRPLLETELNEMQKIQEDARASLIRQIVPTGFLETIRKDFLGSSIVCNPNNLDNSIAIAPSRFIVNGYESIMEGKDIVNGVAGYTIVNLGDAPFAAVKYYDFVFMEIWFEELDSQSNIYKYGYVNGSIIKNNMVDDRVKEETSRRVGIKYKVRVHHGVDIDKWPYGFGFNNINDYSNIYASGPKTAPIENSDYLFVNATNPMFKDTTFYGDNGLFVAGRPNSNLNTDFGVLDNYIFAVPLFAVKRRNQKPYSLSEPNGAPKYINSNIASDRPDRLFYNRIVDRDIQDLRKIISFGQINKERLLDNNLYNLISGNLTTKSKEVVERIQFGVAPIDTSFRTDIVLDVQFDNSTSAVIGPIPTIEGTPQYDLCATGYGINIDGNTIVSYRSTNWIDKEQGTIEFFLKPYWDGADSNISQTIFTITDDLNNTIMSLRKEEGTFVFTQKQNASISSDINKTLVLLNSTKINNNNIYHVRITWDKNNNENNIYVNGEKVGFGPFLLSALTPTSIKIGANEDINYYTSSRVGFVIDSLMVYNRVLEETFPQLDFDISSGYAKIFPSFNGILRSFKDNVHVQENIVTKITTINNSNTVTLSVPHDISIGTKTPVVYNALTGIIYDGTWSGLNSSTANFTLTGSSKFNGETIWIQYDISVNGGNGIDNIPSKILKVQMNDEEVAFAKYSENIKEVQLVNEDGTFETTHKAYDYNLNKNGDDAFVRTINYVFTSNGTNKYVLPKKLYGFNVVGVYYVDRPLKKLTKNTDGSFLIELVNTVLYNDTFTVEVALGGFAIDYDPHSKSIVSNVMNVKTIKIVATGDTDTFKIPVCSESDSNSGIIVSFLGLYHNMNSVRTELGTSVFLDGEFTQINSISGIGTPFISVQFNSTPQLDKVIEIPVLVTYQPLSTDKFSVWYEYVPYQGILDGNQKKLKRFSNWKVFSTTLGSGNIFVNNIKELSINNASNRLPGGQKLSYLLNGSDISLIGEQFTQSGTLKANKKLRFFNNFVDLIDNDEFDDYFNILDVDITLQKLYGDNQDSKLSPPLSNRGFYLPDTNDSISKYIGAACLVIDEMGNILLFVTGQIKDDSDTSLSFNMIHGDLFKLNNSPILVTRRY